MSLLPQDPADLLSLLNDWIPDTIEVDSLQVALISQWTIRCISIVICPQSIGPTENFDHMTHFMQVRAGYVDTPVNTQIVCPSHSQKLSSLGVFDSGGST